MSKQEDYCEGWGPLYYSKMIKLQVVQQGQQNLVDSQAAEIAALKAEVERTLDHLRNCTRAARIDVLEEVLDDGVKLWIPDPTMPDPISQDIDRAGNVEQALHNKLDKLKAEGGAK